MTSPTPEDQPVPDAPGKQVTHAMTDVEEEGIDLEAIPTVEGSGPRDGSGISRSKAASAVIPGYTILRRIGQGGMGTVYEAEQHVPRRRVALKVVNADHASPRQMKRIELEAQVLGLLHHPGIAHVFEAGTFDAGAGLQPFFAMELVRGPTLHAYVETNKPSLRDRLEILARICDAVQHAHQKGIIHRDLKPDNIIINEAGQPKVLDFGVARVTDPEHAPDTMYTRAGVVVGTLPYMSPEQVQGDRSLVDTRTDVYALGVIGFQLMTGRLPFEMKGLSAVDAAVIIRMHEPASLSSIDRSLRGDIETIIGKAIEKERERRYQSAAELAGDIRRHLNDEPIIARPPTLGYQLRKFAKRNKVLAVSMAGVFVSLILGLSAALWQADVARHERDHAEHARKEAENAREEARAHAAEARAKAELSERTTEFVMDVFETANFRFKKSRVFQAKDIIKAGAGRLRFAKNLDPRTRREVTLMMANAYSDIEESKDALNLLRSLLADYRRGDPHDPRGEIVAMLAMLRPLDTPEGSMEAVEVAREALDKALEAGGPGDELCHAALGALGWSLHRSGLHLRDSAMQAEGIDILDQHLIDTLGRFGERDIRYATALQRLAVAKAATCGTTPDPAVETLFTQAIRIAGIRGSNMAELCGIQTDLGRYHLQTGNSTGARTAMEQALASARGVRYDLILLTSIRNLADLLAADPTAAVEADRLDQEYISHYPYFYYVEGADSSRIRLRLATRYHARGSHEMALDMVRRSFGGFRNGGNDCAPGFQPHGELLITILLDMGRIEDAESAAQDIMAWRGKPCGEENPARAEAAALIERVEQAKGG